MKALCGPSGPRRPECEQSIQRGKLRFEAATSPSITDACENRLRRLAAGVGRLKARLVTACDETVAQVRNRRLFANG